MALIWCTIKNWVGLGSERKKKTICESSCLWQIKPNEVSKFDIVLVRPVSAFHLMGMLGMIWC